MLSNVTTLRVVSGTYMQHFKNRHSKVVKQHPRYSAGVEDTQRANEKTIKRTLSGIKETSQDDRAIG